MCQYEQKGATGKCMSLYKQSNQASDAFHHFYKLHFQNRFTCGINKAILLMRNENLTELIWSHKKKFCSLQAKKQWARCSHYSANHKASSFQAICWLAFFTHGRNSRLRHDCLEAGLWTESKEFLATKPVACEPETFSECDHQTLHWKKSVFLSNWFILIHELHVQTLMLSGCMLRTHCLAAASTFWWNMSQIDGSVKGLQCLRHSRCVSVICIVPCQTTSQLHSTVLAVKSGHEISIES